MVNMNDLGITFEQEQPQRHLRSNIKTYVMIGCTGLVAFLAFRAWITRDTVTSFHSNDTITSIQVIKNANSVNHLHENLGNPAILGPLTLNELFDLSDRNIALHLNELGQISETTIDNELSEDQISNLMNIGLYSINSGGRTLISTNLIETEKNPSTRFTLHALNPFFDGKIRGANEPGWLSIHKNGLTLHNLGEKPEIKTEISIPEGSTVTAQLTSVESNATATTNLAPAVPTPLNLFISNLDKPWKLVLSQNTEGNSHYSLLIEHSFELEELAELAKYISSLSSLSTTALTLDDETRVTEITTASNADVSISTEQDTHFIHILQDQSELHLTQTPSHLLITNYTSSPSLDDSKAESSCKSNAHTFASIDSLNPTESISNINNSLDSIAINKHSIFFCW